MAQVSYRLDDLPIIQPTVSKHRRALTTTTPQLFYGWPFFRDHPGEPVPEENCWTLWCKGRLTEADTPTIQLGATPSGLTSAHIHHPPPIFFTGQMPFLLPNQQHQSTEGPIIENHPQVSSSPDSSEGDVKLPLRQVSNARTPHLSID